MRRILVAAGALLLILPRGGAAIDILDTRLLAQPAVSATGSPSPTRTICGPPIATGPRCGA